MTARKRPYLSVALVDAIQTSIARGEEPGYTATRLGCPVAAVHAVRAEMDAVNDLPDTVPAAPTAYGRTP